ncbi:MAG TPA: response regulator [Gammaproteobacteria bacterium]|nr:response regulator [Gammaproteobacteria bacterium]
MQQIVFVVDDDEAVRDALRLLLKSAHLPVQDYASPAEFLESYDPRQGGCLVLDIHMPGLNGLQLQDELSRRGGGIPIVFITGHGDVSMAVQAMKQGAVEFLQKPFRDEDLLGAIRKAFERDRKHREQYRESDGVRRRYDTLTPREKEIMQKVAAGQSSKQIANELDISQRTVEIHRGSVMQKMQADSVAALVKMMLLVSA